MILIIILHEAKTVSHSSLRSVIRHAIVSTAASLYANIALPYLNTLISGMRSQYVPSNPSNVQQLMNEMTQNTHAFALIWVFLVLISSNIFHMRSNNSHMFSFHFQNIFIEFVCRQVVMEKHQLNASCEHIMLLSTNFPAFSINSSFASLTFRNEWKQSVEEAFG